MEIEKKILIEKLWTRVNKGYEYFIFNNDIIYKNILFFARRENKQNPLFSEKDFKKLINRIKCAKMPLGLSLS